MIRRGAFFLIIWTVAFISPQIFAQTTFSDVAESIGVEASYGNGKYSGGVSFFDFNRDGWDDITIATQEGDPLLFYVNVDGVFEKSRSINIDNTYETKHILWVDYDNDSDYDLFVTSLQGDRLYQNNGDLVFEDITVQSGLQILFKETYGAVWGDYNNDGWLDLYVTYYGLQEPNKLYKNNWNGTFTDVSKSSKTSDSLRHAFCATFFDFNNDNHQDIYIANDRRAGNTLLKNLGDGTFEDVSVLSSTKLALNTMGIAINDFDKNSYVDLYLSNTSDGNRLLRNLGNETFSEEADQWGVSFFGIAWGVNFFDFDNDGDADLYVSGSNVGSDVNSSALFENISQSFIRPTNLGMLGDTVKSHVNSIGDFNNDGYPDIVVNNNDFFPAMVWANSGNENSWLKIELEGVKSNRDAIGSKINVYTDNNFQTQTLHCGIAFMGQNTQHTMFGFGKNSTVNSIEIQWPSGHRDYLYNVDLNQSIKVTEGSTTELEVQLVSNKASFSICPKNDTLLLSTGLNKDDKYSFNWSNGSTDGLIEVTQAGTYSVSISSEYLALDIELEATIFEYNQPLFEIEQQNILCYGESSGAIFFKQLTENDELGVVWSTGASTNTIDNIEAGEYTLDIIDENGCIYDTVIFVSEPLPLNLLLTIDAPSADAKTNTVEINVSGGAPPYQIYWESEEIENESRISNIQAGVYTVTVQDNNKCTELFTVDIPIITSINYTSQRTGGIQLYPNPSDDFLYIEFDNIIKTKHLKVQIHDIQGKLILSKRFPRPIDSSRFRLPITNLREGMYTIAVYNYSDSTSVIQRLFIKQ